MFATVDLASVPYISRPSTGRAQAQLQKFTVDVRRTAKRVLETHSSDKVAHLFVNPRSTTERAGFPSSERTEALAMLAYDRLGPDDRYGVKDARKATTEPHEQNAIGPGQI